MIDERIGAFGGTKNNGKPKCSENTGPSVILTIRPTKFEDRSVILVM
jgi:hypothetical protein